MLDSVDRIMGPGAWVALGNAHLLEMQSFAWMRGRTHEAAFVIADEVRVRVS
jgi:phosphate starvation-inducible protein PhoH